MTTLQFVVTEQDTAQALGSGDVPVLATPRLLAWLEAATVEAARPWTGEGRTSVGVEVHMRHRRASSVGARIVVEVTAVDGTAAQEDRPGRLVMEVEARELPGNDPTLADGPLIATGQVIRAVVDRATFLSRL